MERSIGNLSEPKTERASSFLTVDRLEDAVSRASVFIPRIYLGFEFCLELLPSSEELERAIRIAREKALALTLCTPPIPETYLSHVLDLMDFLANEAPETEIVVNDWGLLKAMQSYPFPLSAGRTFQKNKRDSRILTLWPTLSPVMQAFYRGNNVLQPSFLAFLRRFRITRVEIDFPPWGIDPELLRNSDLPVSLHGPFTYVTTSHVCPTLATVAQAAGGAVQVHRCSRPCLTTGFTLKNPAFAAPLLLRGNTYFVENADGWDDSILTDSAVDRMVWSTPVLEG